MKDKPILAIKGLNGYVIHGRCFNPSGVYHVSPCDTYPKECKYAIDMEGVYNKVGISQAACDIWKRPSLNLILPDNNVRNLFEGCIGNRGSIQGHEFDGNLDNLKSCDSVGLEIYVKILLKAGGILVYQS